MYSCWTRVLVKWQLLQSSRRRIAYYCTKLKATEKRKSSIKSLRQSDKESTVQSSRDEFAPVSTSGEELLEQLDSESTRIRIRMRMRNRMSLSVASESGGRVQWERVRLRLTVPCRVQMDAAFEERETAAPVIVGVRHQQWDVLAGGIVVSVNEWAAAWEYLCVRLEGLVILYITKN